MVLMRREISQTLRCRQSNLDAIIVGQPGL